MGQAYQQQPQQPMAAAPPRHQQQQQAPYVYYPHPPPQGVVAGHPPAFVPVGAGPAGAPAGSSKKHKIKKGFKKLSLSSRRESQHPPEYHHSRQQQPPFQQPQPHPQPRRAFSGASSFDAARSGGHGKTQQQDNAGIVLYKPAPAFCARFSLPSNCSDNVLFEGTCCAVSGSIVLDGMCYVTTNFFCFSCNFEGQTIAIKIAHSDIESLRRAYAKEYVLRRHKLPTIQREPPPCTHKHFNTLQMVTRSDNVLHTFFNFQSRKHYDALISTITERCPKAYTMNVKKPLEGDEHDRYEERYEETREKEKERNYDSSSEEEDSSDEAKEKGGKRSSSSSSTYHPPAALHEDKGLLDVY
ncbi:Protein kinase domain-containing protein, variant 2 [Balamuthia mandrillaris]